MRSAFGKPKIAFLLLFMLFSIGFSVCNVGASPDAETLYVDGFDSTYMEWAESGSSPYIDDSNDYIYESSDGDREGYFTFADTTHSGDIFNSVEIYLECYQVGSGEWFEVWIYDGSSWSDLGDITPDTSYSWKSMNITSKIDSWTKADAWVKDDNATYGIRNWNTTASQTVYVWFESVTGAAYVANATVFVIDENGSTELAKITTDGASNLGESNAQSWTASHTDTGIDTLRIWVQGESTVGAVTINLGMKTAE